MLKLQIFSSTIILEYNNFQVLKSLGSKSRLQHLRSWCLGKQVGFLSLFFTNSCLQANSFELASRHLTLRREGLRLSAAEMKLCERSMAPELSYAHQALKLNKDASRLREL